MGRRGFWGGGVEGEVRIEGRGGGRGGGRGVEAERISVRTVGVDGGGERVEEGECRNCSSLVVRKREEEVGLLQTQAVMQAGAAGVVWLAFMSGVMG